MSKVTDAISALIQQPVEQLGYSLVDIEFKKESIGWVLTVYIDHEHGIGLEDCEKVSALIDPIIDENDPINQRYYLSVSSPGLDRPLKTEADFQRKIGSKVIVKLYAPLQGKREIAGVLSSFDSDVIFLDLGKETVSVERKGIALIKPWIEF
ncbi:MAG: ribosome maturation factor RimP [Christensenellales bacterium]